MTDVTAAEGVLEPGTATRAQRRWALGAINLAGAFGLSAVLWFVLLHPNGVLKLFTPMYGFSLTAVLVAVIVAMSRVAERWPFCGPAPAPWRGAVLAAAACAVTAAVVYGFFWGFLGRYGVTYFSPRAIVAAGGVGAEFFNARESSSTAILYFAAAFLWPAVALPSGFGSWPWAGATPGVRAFSRLAVVTVVAAVVFAVLFHPHVTQLFYPAQIMAGVPPWWAGLAQSGSAYFNLGWVMATIAVLVVADVLWDGWPWRLAGASGPVRGIVATSLSLAAGLALFAAALRGMTAFWGEAFQGGQYTDAPYFRHLHVAEMAGFLVLSTFCVDTYLGPSCGGAQRVLSTVLAVAGAVALHLFYYSAAATSLLGKVPGMAQPEDTPLAWTLLFLALVLVQRDFLGRWPLRAPEHRP